MLLYALVYRRACGRIPSSTDRAVRAPVVGAEAAAVVVPEFDYHVVAGFDAGGHGGEPPLAGEAARGTSADGVVHYRQTDVSGEVRAPT